ncbi:MAG: transposase [Planctomycetia bacterium]|nr:transposase [Planctomycetia bacterium]
MDHTCDGFACFIHTSQIIRHHPASYWLPSRTSEGLLVHELLQKGYTVYAINPKAVNRYKDRHVLSKAKSDVLDALSLGHLLRTDRHLFRPLKPLPEDYRLSTGFAATFGKRLMKIKNYQPGYLLLERILSKGAGDVFLNSQIFINFSRLFPITTP